MACGTVRHIQGKRLAGMNKANDLSRRFEMEQGSR